MSSTSPCRVFNEWKGDTEDDVVKHLNRHDRHLLRKASTASREALASKTTRIGLDPGEFIDTSKEIPDLLTAFPSITSLIFSNKFNNGWPRWFPRFVDSNFSVLKNLVALSHIALDAASTAQSLACLTGLRQLSARAHTSFPASAWSSLGTLSNLEELGLSVHGQEPCAPHIAAALPSLRRLDLTISHLARQQGLEALGQLTHLEELKLTAVLGRDGINERVIRNLSVITGLAQLWLFVDETPVDAAVDAAPQEQPIVDALTKLSSLSCLILNNFDVERLQFNFLTTLTQLTELQTWSLGSALPAHQLHHLTSLSTLQQLDVQLRDLEAMQQLPQQLTTQLEALTIDVSDSFDLHQHPAQPYSTKGLLSIYDNLLKWFCYSNITVLEVCLIDATRLDDLQASLASATQLQSLSLQTLLPDIFALEAELLRSIANIKSLQNLWLQGFILHQPYIITTLASWGCRKLQRLTLDDVGPLSYDATAALMGMRSLRMLRLLGCDGAPDQEQCQMMLGQLRRFDLLVDALTDDGMVKSKVLMDELKADWRLG